jgi:hypothetical protein
MGRACGTHGETNAYTVFEGNLKKIDHMGDLDIDRRIVLEYIFKN